MPRDDFPQMHAERTISKSLSRRLADFLFGYDFFISYAWSDGREYAIALNNELEKQGYECFLDSNNYRPGDNWRLVGRRAIRKTGRLILVATRGSLNSEPVERELEAFSQTLRQVIPIDCDGCLKIREKESGSKVLQWLSQDLLFIAEHPDRPEIGPSKAVLQRIRDGFQMERQDRKRIRWLTYAIIAFALLASGIGILACVAYWQRTVAVAAKEKAELKTRIATARQLAAQSTAELSSHPQRSLLLAVAAINASRPGEPTDSAAETALRMAVEQVNGVPLESGGPTAARSLSADGNWLVTSATDGTLRRWNLASAMPFETSDTLGTTEKTSGLTLSPTGKWLVVRGDRGMATLWNTQLKDPATASIPLTTFMGDLRQALFSPDEQWLLTSGQSKYVDMDQEFKAHGERLNLDDIARMDPGSPQLEIWNLGGATGPSGTSIPVYEFVGRPEQVQFGPRSDWLAIYDSVQKALHLKKVGREGRFSPIKGPTDEGMIRAFRFSDDGRMFVTGSENGAIRLWDLSHEDPAVASAEIPRAGDANQPPAAVLSVAFSRGGRWLAAGTANGNVEICELQSGSRHFVRLIDESNASAVVSLQFSPDSRWLVSTHRTLPADEATGATPVGDEESLTPRIWDLEGSTAQDKSRRLHRSGGSLGPENSDASVLFTSDSLWLAIQTREKVCWWMLPESKASNPPLPWGSDSDVSCLALLGNRGILAGRTDGKVHLWPLNRSQAATGPSVLLWHEAAATQFVIAKNNRSLATFDSASFAAKWQLDSDGAPLHRGLIRDDQEIRQMEIDSSGKWLATRSDNNPVVLRRLESSLPSAGSEYVDQGYFAQCMQVSGDSRWLAVGGEKRLRLDGEEPGLVIIADLQAASPTIRRLSGGLTNVLNLKFSRDSRWLTATFWPASVNDTTCPGGVVLWDLNAADPSGGNAGNPCRVATSMNPGSFHHEFDADNRWLAVETEGKTVLWNLRSSLVPTIHKTIDGTLSSFSPNGLLTRDRQSPQLMRLWDLRGSEPVATSLPLPSAEDHAYYGHQFNATGTALLLRRFESFDLWKIRSEPSEVTRLDVPAGVLMPEDGAMQFSNDGNWVAVATHSGTHLGDISAIPVKWQKLKEIEARELHFSDDSQWLAANDARGNVRIWHLANQTGTERESHVLLTNAGEVKVGFSPDVRWIAASTADGVIRLWDLRSPTAAPVTVKCHAEPIREFRFSANSSCLLIRGTTSVLALPLKLETLVRQAQETSNRKLTISEEQQYFVNEPK